MHIMGHGLASVHIMGHGLALVCIVGHGLALVRIVAVHVIHNVRCLSYQDYM